MRPAVLALSLPILHVACRRRSRSRSRSRGRGGNNYVSWLVMKQTCLHAARCQPCTHGSPFCMALCLLCHGLCLLYFSWGSLSRSLLLLPAPASLTITAAPGLYSRPTAAGARRHLQPPSGVSAGASPADLFNAAGLPGLLPCSRLPLLLLQPLLCTLFTLHRPPACPHCRRDRSPPPARGSQLFVAGLPFMMVGVDCCAWVQRG